MKTAQVKLRAMFGKQPNETKFRGCRASPLFFLIFLGILFTGKPEVFALPLEDLLDQERIDTLRAGTQEPEIQFKDVSFTLVPRHEELRRLLETVQSELNPSVMVETLYLYEKPAGADKTGWTQTELAALYNEATALSALRGIEYYSASRGTMRTFYEISTIIDGPLTKNAVPDPVFPAPLPELTLYARQKDLTFGDNTYQYTYRLFSGAMIFIQENLSTMFAGIIPAVGKGKLRSVLALLDAGDHLLIYAVSMVKSPSLPGLRERIGNSFSNRTDAIIQWIAGGADRAFGKDR